MPRNSEIKTDIQARVPRTLQGTERIWHEFWKTRNQYANSPGIRARVRLTQPGQENSRFVLETGDGHQFVVNDIEGGSGSQPIELLAGALAGCVALDVIALLRRKEHQRLTGYEVRVEAEQAERPPKTFVAVRIHHIVSGEGLDPAAVGEAIRTVEQTCVVQALLRHTATITTTFEVVKEIAGAPPATPAPDAELTSVPDVPSARRRGSGQTS
jgi:putative redox protein